MREEGSCVCKGILCVRRDPVCGVLCVCVGCCVGLGCCWGIGLWCPMCVGWQCCAWGWGALCVWGAVNVCVGLGCLCVWHWGAPGVWGCCVWGWGAVCPASLLALVPHGGAGAARSRGSPPASPSWSSSGFLRSPGAARSSAPALPGCVGLAGPCVCARGGSPGDNGLVLCTGNRTRRKRPVPVGRHQV